MPEQRLYAIKRPDGSLECLVLFANRADAIRQVRLTSGFTTHIEWRKFIR